jgi:hypothetical protein
LIQIRQADFWSAEFDNHAKQLLNAQLYLHFWKEKIFLLDLQFDCEGLGLSIQTLNTDLWISTMYVGSMVFVHIKRCF